jgi:hypothetical protein
MNVNKTFMNASIELFEASTYIIKHCHLVIMVLEAYILAVVQWHETWGSISISF